jgi:hypothetical protein
MRSKAVRDFLTIVACGLSVLAVAAHAALADCRDDAAGVPVAIERMPAVPGEGEGYRLTYCVGVPLEVYWLFKTDFHNDFLTGNPHIATHQFIRRQGNVVLTENRYTHNTERIFRWQTTVFASEHRLDFKLMNPQQAGQQFHFGRIRAEAQGRNTVIHQEARFQFSGAAFWAFYPWRGGMRAFLNAFVAWEQETVRAWESHYAAQRPLKNRDQARWKDIFPVNARYPDK